MKHGPSQLLSLPPKWFYFKHHKNPKSVGPQDQWIHLSTELRSRICQRVPMMSKVNLELRSELL
ncbi:hypothetical protein AKJ16_DCAP00388, partial [Drosera capensis]